MQERSATLGVPSQHERAMIRVRTQFCQCLIDIHNITNFKHLNLVNLSKRDQSLVKIHVNNSF